MKLTPLDSNRWQELQYNYVNGSLPETLVDFTNPKSSFEVKDKALDIINDQIFHQTSTYEGTFVVVPILVDTCSKQHLDHKVFIIQLVGLVSLQRGPFPSKLTEAEINTFQQSQKLAYDQAIRLLKEVKTDFESIVDLMSAIAALRGERDLGWRLDQGMEEDRHQCHACEERFQSCCYAILSEDAKSRSDYLNFDEKSMYAQPIKRLVGEQPVKARETFPSDSIEGWLTSLCEDHGHSKCGQWLRYFFGTSACPNCGAENDLLGAGAH